MYTFYSHTHTHYMYVYMRMYMLYNNSTLDIIHNIVKFSNSIIIGSGRPIGLVWIF